MIKKSILELQENFIDMEQLCFESMDPICFEQNQISEIVMMNMSVYDNLTRDFDMLTRGIELHIYDVLGYREKIQIYCKETKEPVFVATDKGEYAVFMDIILYNYLAGNPPEYEDDILLNPPKRKPNRPKKAVIKTGGNVYSFDDIAKRSKQKN